MVRKNISALVNLHLLYGRTLTQVVFFLLFYSDFFLLKLIKAPIVITSFRCNSSICLIHNTILRISLHNYKNNPATDPLLVYTLKCSNLFIYDLFILNFLPRTNFICSAYNIEYIGEILFKYKKAGGCYEK